jgi:hypothetical protein
MVPKQQLLTLLKGPKTLAVCNELEFLAYCHLTHRKILILINARPRGLPTLM